MKKKARFIVITMALTLVIAHYLLQGLLGFSPLKVGEAIAVATHMGAKLGCSAYFVSGYDKPQIIDDLASYSPINKKLHLHIDEKNATVTASLWGMQEISARYREGLGCTLTIGDVSGLDSIVVPHEPSNEVAPWPSGAEVNSIAQPRQALLDEILAADNQAGYQTRALVLVEDGTITAESYAEGFGPHTQQLGWSMGKSITAIMLGRMVYLGMADINTNTLFPQWRDDARSDIRLKHLLTMSSGLEFDETYAPGSDSVDMLFGAHSASDIVLKKTLGHQPGSHFSYSSGTTNLLMRWMHDQLGGTVASTDFLFREIFSPMNVRHSVLEPDPSGVFVGSSFMYSSARDWARFGLLMLNKGVINDTRLVSEAWVAQSAAVNATDNKKNYGYQFWLNQKPNKAWPLLPEDVYFMTGNRKQYVMIAPSHNAVIVRLGWTKGTYPMEKNFAKILAKN